jgi:DAPG hydrolase PhiG domain
MTEPATPADLLPYLSRPMTPPSEDVQIAIERGPIAAADALLPTQLDRLLDPTPLAAETGWCTLDDGTGYVAVLTPMPGVTSEMVDWWYTWNPRDPIRGPEAPRLHGTHLGGWEPPATVLPRISRTYMARARPNGGTR